MDIYHIAVGTFRRTLELRVGGTKKEFEEFAPQDFDYNLTGGIYRFDEENNCNIIWLRKYDLGTLSHELMHCVLEILKQVGLEAEGESPAFIYEELFTKIMMQCGNKFKIDKDTENFRK